MDTSMTAINHRSIRAGADANCISACSDYCRVRFGSVRALAQPRTRLKRIFTRQISTELLQYVGPRADFRAVNG